MVKANACATTSMMVVMVVEVMGLGEVEAMGLEEVVKAMLRLRSLRL